MNIFIIFSDKQWILVTSSARKLLTIFLKKFNSYKKFNFIGFTLPISTELCQLKRIPQPIGSVASIPANFDFASKSYLWIFSSEKNGPEKCFVKFPTFAMDTKRTFSDAFQANLFLPLPAGPAKKVKSCQSRTFSFSYPKQAQSVIPMFKSQEMFNEEEKSTVIKAPKLNANETKKFYFATPTRIN